MSPRRRIQLLTSDHSRRRTLLSAGAVALLAAAVVMASASPAYAYLDPGTGAMVLQLLIGGVAGALVVGKLYFAKIKAFCASLFSRRLADQKRRDGS